MKFDTDDKGRLTATVQGKLTGLDKYVKSRTNSKGFEYYQGTHLDVSVTACDIVEYIFEGTTYRTPESFVLDCYESLRMVLGNKESKNPSISTKKMRELKELCEGKDVTISMGLVKETTGVGPVDLCVMVVVTDFCKDGKPLFYGKVQLEQVL